MFWKASDTGQKMPSSISCTPPAVDDTERSKSAYNGLKRLVKSLKRPLVRPSCYGCGQDSL
jgi:hypothetical protein